MKTGLLAALILLLNGCASTGAKIDTAQLGEIRKGQTTVAEIIKKFGRPNLLSKNWDGTQTVAYANTDGQSDAGTLLPIMGAVVAGASSGVDSVIFYFNTSGVLTDYKTTQTPESRAEQASVPEPVVTGSSTVLGNAAPTKNAASTPNVVAKPAPARAVPRRSDGLPFWMPREISDPRNQ